MDRVLSSWCLQTSSFADGDLTLLPQRGVAFQTDMKVTAKYDSEYWDKCAGYEDGEIARLLNRGRVAFVARHCGRGALICDVGIGSGDFIRHRANTLGIDVNPTAVRWLKDKGLWAYDLTVFDGFTFWDVIEHVPEPHSYLDCIDVGSYAFFSIPVFRDLVRIRDSRHYRPGEHLYYWTLEGFKSWMESYGFVLRELDMFESNAGRDSITSFAFRREHARV